jgi:hypothetical protein
MAPDGCSSDKSFDVVWQLLAVILVAARGEH